jgi:hypothetical protein
LQGLGTLLNHAKWNNGQSIVAGFGNAVEPRVATSFPEKAETFVLLRKRPGGRQLRSHVLLFQKRSKSVSIASQETTARG